MKLKFKLITIFGKSLKVEIKDLTENILTHQWESQIKLKKTDSAGIIDGKQIIWEYLDYNEVGCAFDHLKYVINETEIDLTTDQTHKINLIHRRLSPKDK